MPKIEIVKDRVYLNNKPLFLEKGGRYSEVDYYFTSVLSKNGRYAQREEEEEIAQYFQKEIDGCVENCEQIDNLLENLPLDFSAKTAKELADDLNALPEDLLASVKLNYEDEPDDDGFRRPYWTHMSDVQKYPYFSALSLYVGLREENYSNSYKITRAQAALDKANSALEKAKKEYEELAASLADCNDAEYVANKLKGALFDTYKEEVTRKEEELNALKINTKDLLDQIKGSNAVFDDMLNKLVTYKPI